MSGTSRIDRALSGQDVATDEPGKLSYYVNRLLNPLVRLLLVTVNRLTGTVTTVTEDTTLDGSEGLVLVDATSGPVTITLSAPTQLFHAVAVQKADATANVVTVASPVGSTMNGAGSVSLVAQWDRTAVFADDSDFYAG